MSSGRERLRSTLLLLAGVALLGASAEIAIALVRKFAFGDLLRVSRDNVWMAPFGELMLLVPAFVLLQLGGFAWPRLRTTRSVLFVLLFVALCSVFLFLGFLNDIAVVLLAAGVSWQLSRAAADARPRTFRILRAAAPGLALLFLVLGLALRVSDVVRERRALAALPVASAGAPNVILIIWDTVRAASLSLYGHDRSTSPNLDALASQGVVFDAAMSTSSWTLPAHVSMFTGYLPHQTRANWDTPFDLTRRTLAEELSANGYATAGFSSNMLYVQWESGLTAGFARFEDYRVTPGQVFLSTALGRRLATGQHGWGTGPLFRLAGYTEFLGRKRADDVNRALLDWIDRREERPYFAFLNLYDAHLPYLPPEPFAGRFERPRPRTSLLDRLNRERGGFEYWDLSPEGIEAELAAYEESIAYMDDRLGLLMSELDARGELDNTIIIVAADHGEAFGEHDDFEHGTNLFMEQIHVPLVVIYPGHVPGGIRVTDPVSVRDIPATVADLAGLRGPMPFPGSSLARRWTAAPDTPMAAISELTPGLRPDVRMCSAVGPQHHLVRNPDGTAEAYDWRADPGELVNIITQPGTAESVGQLAAVLDGRGECKGPQRRSDAHQR